MEHPSAIYVELDDGSLFNDGEDESNVAHCDPSSTGLPRSHCETSYYALRNIQKGEELLCNYDDFWLDGWELFGL